jgi:hypothetical protein
MHPRLQRGVEKLKPIAVTDCTDKHALLGVRLCVFIRNTVVCQDRLGTNTRTVGKQEVVPAHR